MFFLLSFRTKRRVERQVRKRYFSLSFSACFFEAPSAQIHTLLVSSIFRSWIRISFWPCFLNWPVLSHGTERRRSGRADKECRKQLLYHKKRKESDTMLVENSSRKLLLSMFSYVGQRGFSLYFSVFFTGLSSSCPEFLYFNSFFRILLFSSFSFFFDTHLWDSLFNLTPLLALYFLDHISKEYTRQRSDIPIRLASWVNHSSKREGKASWSTSWKSLPRKPRGKGKHLLFLLSTWMLCPLWWCSWCCLCLHTSSLFIPFSCKNNEVNFKCLSNNCFSIQFLLMHHDWTWGREMESISFLPTALAFSKTVLLFKRPLAELRFWQEGLLQHVIG